MKKISLKKIDKDGWNLSKQDFDKMASVALKKIAESIAKSIDEIAQKIDMSETDNSDIVLALNAQSVMLKNALNQATPPAVAWQEINIGFSRDKYGRIETPIIAKRVK